VRIVKICDKNKSYPLETVDCDKKWHLLMVFFSNNAHDTSYNRCKYEQPQSIYAATLREQWFPETACDKAPVEDCKRIRAVLRKKSKGQSGHAKEQGNVP
jgi:hypothetical protein